MLSVSMTNQVYRQNPLFILKQYVCLQDCVSTVQQCTSANESDFEPPAASARPCAALQRQDTDHQRTHAWSAGQKILKSATSLKKAAKKLRPSDTKRNNLRGKMIQGLRKIRRTVVPCFQGQVV